MHTRKQYFTYVMASRTRRLYTGMTNNLLHRAHQHRTGAVEGFTKRYNITRLVYYETYDYVWDAITREKHIKGLTRSKKFALIESLNPDWNDLYLVLNPEAIGENPRSSNQESISDDSCKNETRQVNRGGDSSLRSE
jgi:putative endonuclease